MCGLGHTFSLGSLFSREEYGIFYEGSVVALGNIVDGNIQEYIRQLLPSRDILMTSLEEKAEREHVSIVAQEVAQFLYCLAAQKRARHILEIGTAIGYSTIWLARVARENDGRVTTIEINQRRYEKALQSIEKSGLHEVIQVIKGHATDILPTLEESYDFIFVDAAKGQYSLFLEVLYPKLEPGGLIVFDNVLAEGLVICDDEVIARRQRTMIRRLREFLQVFVNHPGLISTIIPMGDGIAFGVKK